MPEFEKAIETIISPPLGCRHVLTAEFNEKTQSANHSQGPHKVSCQEGGQTRATKGNTENGDTRSKEKHMPHTWQCGHMQEQPSKKSRPKTEGECKHPPSVSFQAGPWPGWWKQTHAAFADLDAPLETGQLRAKPRGKGKEQFV